MPQPFTLGGQNPVAEVILGYGQLRGQEQRGQALAQEQQKQAKQQEFQNNLKMMQQQMSLMSDTNLPGTMKKQAWNAFAPIWNKLNPQNPVNPLPEGKEWPKKGSEFAKRASKIWDNVGKEGGYTMETARQALIGLHLESQAVGEEIDIKNVLKATEPTPPVTLSAGARLVSPTGDVLTEAARTPTQPPKNIKELIARRPEWAEMPFKEFMSKVQQIGIGEKRQEAWTVQGTTAEGAPVLMDSKTGKFKLGEVNKVGGQLWPKIQNPTSQMVTDMSQMQTVQTMLGRVSSNLTDDVTREKMRRNVGVLKGRFGVLADKLKGDDPERSAFYADLAHSFEIVYSMSGKQVSDKEIERFKPFLPNPNLPYDTLEARVGALSEYIDILLRNRKMMSAAGGRPFRGVESPGGAGVQSDPLGLFPGGR